MVEAFLFYVGSIFKVKNTGRWTLEGAALWQACINTECLGGQSGEALTSGSFDVSVPGTLVP